MNEFQWWVLIVGLVAGGTIVGLLTANFGRRDADLEVDEQEAEATFIASHLSAGGRAVDRATVADVLEAHREYLGLPAPDAILPVDVPAGAGSAGDGYADDESDDVGHAGRRPTDRDLSGA
ncbi:MAG TPA: hypothetical protein VJ506_11720 [Candidatus Limnocylindrales bacterium]|nr:hypothetical protein [Candidatus Limnocylindrales bacterium]